MTNKILIDGWNLCWKIPELRTLIPENLEKARTLLNSKIKSYFASKKTIFKIVYDGKTGTSYLNGYVRGIDVRFSKKPETADHLLVSFLAKQKNPREWTIITSDRSLREHATSLGAEVVDSDMFADKIKPQYNDSEIDFKHNPNLKSAELEYWRKQFGVDSEKKK
jgi:predicted RNA-binding protein with PIN domain